jgi:plasmid stabilization system protein ParE
VTVPVRVAPRALDWIRRETEYLSERNLKAAERFRAALARGVQQLSAHPHSGRPGLIPGTRILVRGDYLISYRVTFERDGMTPHAVEIFAVRHARQADAREPS